MTKAERLRLAKEYLEVHAQLEQLRETLATGTQVEAQLAEKLLQDIPPGKMGKATIVAETLLWIEEQEQLDFIAEPQE